MKQKHQPSAIPLFAAAGVWVVYALLFPLYRMGHFLIPAALFASQADVLAELIRDLDARGAWGGFGISAAVLVALMCAARFDVYGYERRVPDPASVESVYLFAGGERESDLL